MCTVSNQRSYPCVCVNIDYLRELVILNQILISKALITDGHIIQLCFSSVSDDMTRRLLHFDYENHVCLLILSFKNKLIDFYTCPSFCPNQNWQAAVQRSRRNCKQTNRTPQSRIPPSRPRKSRPVRLYVM